MCPSFEHVVCSFCLTLVFDILSFPACCLFILSNPGFLYSQGVLMMKDLMDCCVSQATVVDCVRAKAEASEAKLGELKAWKVVQEKNLDLTKRLLE